ncbi:MAG: PTS ascorbate transporter subunit IIC [Gemmatimonadaceae bacterium]|nr:PTS ascorbate transporter subunit IIC [Gemmatimonadaceae bacterium]
MAEKKAFLLRVDRQLLDQLQRWANDDLRSLNGQIEFLLRDALRRAGRPAKDSPDEPVPDADQTPEP